MSRRASAALALVVAAAALAEPPSQTPTQSPAAKAPALSIPHGPIQITAERADLQQRDTALYRGNVRLVSEDLVLTGDRLELRQPARGEFEARLTGTPAHLSHAGQGDDPGMSATAQEIVYDTRTQIADLTGGVELERGSDTLSSDRLRYDVGQRRITAAGSTGGQVKIIIQPEGKGLEKLEQAEKPQQSRPRLPQNKAPKGALPLPTAPETKPEGK